jgi:DNA-binding transcriptional LysR family regulator
LLEALASHDWIVGSAGSPLRERWEAMFHGRPMPAIPVECGSVMVIRGVLAGSDLLSLLSPDQVALEIASGMLTTIDAPIASGERTIGITTREGWRPTAAQLRFVGLLEEAVAATRLQESQ